MGVWDWCLCGLEIFSKYWLAVCEGAEILQLWVLMPALSESSVTPPHSFWLAGGKNVFVYAKPKAPWLISLNLYLDGSLSSHDQDIGNSFKKSGAI